jgi:hypothetical protein
LRTTNKQGFAAYGAYDSYNTCEDGKAQAKHEGNDA